MSVKKRAMQLQHLGKSDSSKKKTAMIVIVVPNYCEGADMHATMQARAARGLRAPVHTPIRNRLLVLKLSS